MQIRNEIAVLKSISQGHKNIVTLWGEFRGTEGVTPRPASSLRLATDQPARIIADFVFWSTDYFETQNNRSSPPLLHSSPITPSSSSPLSSANPPPSIVYLVTDLCQGGELFDRICAKQFFHEHDAAKLVETVVSAVAYLHDHGIVHRGKSRYERSGSGSEMGDESL